MSDPNDKVPIDYGGKRALTPAERYERNGWIGLVITLAVCLIVALLYFGLAPSR